jgi:CheY-like chemotaxis protein
VEKEAVETGEAAVELISSGANFNLIVIDMFLPVMNGPEVYILHVSISSY